MLKAISLAILLLGLPALAATRTFKMAAVEIDGTKFWLPSTLIVHRGDSVKIEAMSKVPGEGSVHGLEIKDYGITEVIDSKGKTIEFVAKKAGVFPIGCQLHPAHIGAQLVVLK